MQRRLWIWIGLGAVLIVGIALFSSRLGSSEGEVRRVVDQAQAAAVDGMNQRDPTALDSYFATVAEGAQASGLTETQQAYQNFVAQLPGGTTIQIHSFDITGAEVHEEAGLARVTYRLHLSIIRSGNAIYTITFSQDLALLRTARGWRISGGDTPQVENVTGIWPPQQ